MGLLRFLFAIAVVIAHSSSIFGLTLTGGRVAVEAFFIISGFYMAMILANRYKGQYKLFLTNRLLKLYPLYWAVLFIELSLSIVGLILAGKGGTLNFYFEYFHDMHALAFIQVIFSNIAFLGLDLLYFLGLDPHTGLFFFTTEMDPRLSNLIFINPAWTLSLELTFYLMAPFLVRLRPSLLLTIFMVSLAIKIFLTAQGLDSFPWGHAFFPAELLFFVAGIFAYRVYERHFSGKVINPIYMKGCLLVIVVLIGVFQFLEQLPFFSTAFLLLVFLAVPVIFKLTASSDWDRRLGELSFPLYLSHMLVIMLLRPHITTPYLGLIVVMVSVIFSVFLMKLVMDPVERYRKLRILRRVPVKVQQHV